MQENKEIQEIFLQCSQLGSIYATQQWLQSKNKNMTRSELIQLLQDSTLRENTVIGSTFDLVQQIIKMEQSLELDLRREKKKGSSWKEAIFNLHIGPGPEYGRLKRFFENI